MVYENRTENYFKTDRGFNYDDLFLNCLAVNDTFEADGRLANYQASNGSGQVVRRAVADPEFPRRGRRPPSFG